ncbi:MAG: hypothetical protein AAFV88_13680 [Planctomycetota bacterium]
MKRPVGCVPISFRVFVLGLLAIHSGITDGQTPDAVKGVVTHTLPELQRSLIDRVRLAPKSLSRKEREQARWFPRPLSWQSGRLVTWDADRAEIQSQDDSIETVAGSRVVGFQLSSLSENERTALETLQRGEYAAALPLLIRCVSQPDPKKRPAVWRQQWLSMLAAQAAMRSGRGEIAIELVTQLDRRSLPNLTLSLLPIEWKPPAGQAERLQEAAIKGASSPSPAVKLVAASWLLRSDQYRAAAESAIRRLATQESRPRIAMLARQLTWKQKTPPDLLASLAEWEKEVSSLPMSLQIGPMILLAEQARQVGATEAAQRWKLSLELAAPTWHPDLTRP